MTESETTQDRMKKFQTCLDSVIESNEDKQLCLGLSKLLEVIKGVQIGSDGQFVKLDGNASKETIMSLKGDIENLLVSIGFTFDESMTYVYSGKDSDLLKSVIETFELETMRLEHYEEETKEAASPIDAIEGKEVFAAMFEGQ